MAAITKSARRAKAVGTAMAVAGQNARTGSRLAVASAEVVARRVGLGMQGAADPANADYAELARLVPEKAAAASAAAARLMERSGRLAQQLTTATVNEMVATSRATLRLAACRTPAALAAAQTDLALAWLGRAMAQSIAFATLAMRSQHAAVTPFHRAATANARRLSR
jgi:hypothetical protein